MKSLELAGSATEMGQAFGEACRDEIARLYAIRLRNALVQAGTYGGRDASESDLLALASRCLATCESYDPDGFAELCGIARGANLPVEQVLALNGLTDLRDALAWSGDLEAFGGCTWFIVAPDRSASQKVLCGQTWDLGTDNRPFVVRVHRRPLEGPETWCVTTVGCLSLMGMNAAGIAIGTSNLRTRDARPGVPYLSLIHRALACDSHAAAVSAIAEAPRAGAHAYYVVGPDASASAIECTALQTRVTPVESGVHVHTNHCQVPAHAKIEGDVPRASSQARHRRMSELLDSAEAQRGLTLRDLQQFLADEDGGELAICRDDYDGISTNAAIVMAPGEGTALACHGLPTESGWVDLDVELRPGQ